MTFNFTFTAWQTRKSRKRPQISFIRLLASVSKTGTEKKDKPKDKPKPKK